MYLYLQRLGLLELQKYYVHNAWGLTPKVLFSHRLELLWSFTPGDRTKNPLIFRCRFANSALRDQLGGRSRHALHLKICIIALIL